MKKVSEIIGTILTFLTSTGFTYFGILVFAIGIFIVAPKTFGWAAWMLIGYFICHNILLIRPWALKQWKDVKRKF